MEPNDMRIWVQGDPAQNVGRRVVSVPTEIAAALAKLAGVQPHATQASCSVWDLSIEIGSLGLEIAKIRVAYFMGLVEHAWETTRAGAKKRTFRPDMGVTFCSRSCFVATAPGLAIGLAHLDAAQKTASQPTGINGHAKALCESLSWGNRQLYRQWNVDA
jgi:hypothetical protein